MKLQRKFARILPQWAVLLATDMRCMLRCARVCRSTASRIISGLPTLVVAPHPDDETFGCGGLIRLKRDAGVPVRVVLLADGEAVGGAPQDSQEGVVAARRREFIEACRRLGVAANELRWLHLPDGAVPHPGQPGFHEAASALGAEIEAFAPGEVFCPHEQDVHPDHIAAAHLTRAALNLAFASSWGAGGQKSSERAHSRPSPPTLFYYPIWMWYHASSGLGRRLDLRGAWRLDISRVLQDKRQAMASYLEAPKAPNGNPYCGRLPSSFLRNFRRTSEIFFPAVDS